MTRLALPAEVTSFADRGPGWATWVDRLPALVDEVLSEWALTPDGGPWHGATALVLPVVDGTGAPAVLKLVGPGGPGPDESEHEHLALRAWRGNGAVQLLRADPHRRVLLLERLHPEDLSGVGDLEACEVVAGLYPRLHLPALPQLRTVTSYVEPWTDALQGLPRNAPVPHRLVEQATHLSRALCSDPDSTGVLVHGDLHYGNVLAGDREPWLVIDPKPMSGDPHYELAPMLLNRYDELGGPLSGAPTTGPRVRDGLRRRFHTLVDAAGLDEDRARDWVVVRLVINAHWSIEDAQADDRVLTAAERDWITRCISIVKAVQD